MTTNISEPTGEQCSKHEKVFDDGDQAGYAIWYPQMGGYVGKAVIIIGKEGDSDDCFEALVWHDGQFPFTGEGKNPAKIHHCSADQFIDFGKKVMALQEKEGEGA